MEKKFEREKRLQNIQDEEQRKAESERLQGMDERHKKHEKMHKPLTKDQLEEVWESQDHMRPEEFDLKTFFTMHDLNGDGFLEESELSVSRHRILGL